MVNVHKGVDKKETSENVLVIYSSSLLDMLQAQAQPAKCVLVQNNMEVIYRK